ncbi:hypothetical protein H2203_003115 [Taxawa tesnikishii (nom. ined.)]|nr:hypothetical protein H2203_003115 [Dothideales sp. JES 119]
MGVINIIFDGGRKPYYRGGDTISGVLTYRIPSQETLDGVVVILKGKMSAEIVRGAGESRRRHTEKIELFRSQQTLYSGSYTIQPQTMSWPFSLTFPEYTQFTRSNGVGDPTYENEPHPLPPTIAVRNGSGPPVAPVPIVHPLDFTRWSSSSLRPEQHTFKQKLAHVFTSDPSLATPVIKFLCSVQIPARAEPWTPLPISLSLKHILETPNDPAEPTLVLEQVDLQLKSYSHIRVKALVSGRGECTSSVVATKTLHPSPSSPAATTPSKNLPARLNAHVLRLPLDNTPVVVTQDFTLASMNQTDSGIVPDFSSYIVAHAHRLKITASIRHQESGQLFSVEGPKLGFEVLPWEHAAQRGGLQRGEMQVRPVGSSRTPVEVLPSYQESSSSNSSAGPSSSGAALASTGSNTATAPPAYRGLPGREIGVTSGDVKLRV